MSLLQMSLSAGLMAAAVTVIRGLALNRLPKNVFLILWGMVLLRLLIPFSFESPVSISNKIDAVQSFAEIQSNISAASQPQPSAVFAPEAETEPPRAERKAPAISPLTAVWLAGMSVAFVFFIAAYIRNYRKFRVTVPVNGNEFINGWLSEHKTLRKISVVTSGAATTPLAFGIIKPHIILPASMDLSEEALLNHVLTHEYFHIRRFDAFLKLAAASALCVHWFNPLVWVMFILAGRDMELACDEAVIKNSGADVRADYAFSIIGMAEHRSGFSPLYIGFSKNSAEERINAIMKYKKKSAFALVLSAALIIGTTAAFADGAKQTPSILSPSTPPSSTSAPAVRSAQVTSIPAVPPGESIASKHLSSPITVYGGGVAEEGGQKFAEVTVSNTSPDAVTEFDIAVLLLDENGAPLENGFNVFPIDAYYIEAITIHNLLAAEINLEHLKNEYERLLETGTDEAISELQNDLAEAEKEVQRYSVSDYDESAVLLAPGNKIILTVPVSDEIHGAENLLTLITEATFTDGSVWTNPEFAGWLAEHAGEALNVQPVKKGGAPSVIYGAVEMRRYTDTSRESMPPHPYIHETRTNNTGKTISMTERGMLAFDKNGNPLKIDWLSMDSKTEAAYFFLYDWDSGRIFPGVTEDAFGGWSLNIEGNDPEVEKIAYVLYCDKSITFSDGSVWENPGFEEWRETYEGKKTDVNALKNYYPYTQEIF